MQYVGRAPLEGNDMPYLMASYVEKGQRGPSIMPEGQIATGVMVASNEPFRKQSLGTITVPAKASLDVSEPVTAMAAPVPQFAQQPASFNEFVMLPEIGPIPRERPEYIPMPDGNMAYAAAYYEVRVSDAESPFEAIMVDKKQLTPQVIVDYAKRQKTNGSAR